MANDLEQFSDPVNPNGVDINVIQKEVYPKTGGGSIFFVVLLFILGIIPGLIFLIVKVKAKTYLQQLIQAIQHDASEVDNYLEQRVQILKNAAKLMGKAIDLDKEILNKFANARGANALNEKGAACAQLEKLVNATFEQYPDIKAHNAIEDCMQQNSYLQKEITAARTAYNDRVLQWNSDIMKYFAKRMVASKNGYHTYIPFAVDSATKQAARGDFF